MSCQNNYISYQVMCFLISNLQMITKGFKSVTFSLPFTTNKIFNKHLFSKHFLPLLNGWKLPIWRITLTNKSINRHIFIFRSFLAQSKSKPLAKLSTTKSSLYDTVIFIWQISGTFSYLFPLKKSFLVFLKTYLARFL